MHLHNTASFVLNTQIQYFLCERLSEPDKLWKIYYFQMFMLLFFPQLSQRSHEARITVEVAHCPQHLIWAILGRYKSFTKFLIFKKI
jgi:hypothetical protein